MKFNRLLPGLALHSPCAPRAPRVPRQPVSPKTVALEGPFEHRLLHTRGIRLHAAVAGDPKDPLVLLIHGTFGAWMDFQHVIAPLAEAGFYVAAVDMRGYGMSDKPPAQPGSDVLLALGDIDGVITALGHDTVHLVGHDTGGAMAWVYAAAYPHRVRSLTSISAAHPHDLRTHMLRRPWELMYMTVRVRVGLLPRGIIRASRRFIPTVWRRELTINTAPEFTGTPAFEEALDLRIRAARIDHALRGIVRNSRLLIPKLIELPDPSPKYTLDGPVHAPVLMLHPRQKVWERITQYSRRRAPNTQQMSIPGAKNVPHIEKPGAFVAALSSFLART